MARDDYHVIVYQILAYLYLQLKSGDAVDEKRLMPGDGFLGINETYWQYIMINLLNDGLISGITVSHSLNGSAIIGGLNKCQITPRGIEYLCDNSFMEKAKAFFKDIKAIVPFV